MLIFLDQLLTEMGRQHHNIIVNIHLAIPKASIPALLLAGLKTGDIPVINKKKRCTLISG